MAPDGRRHAGGGAVGRRCRRDGRRRLGASAQLGLPSSYLFGALLVGIAAALLAPGAHAVAPAAFTASLAIAGVVLGTLLDSSSLDAIADGWLPLALVTAATLGISLVAGSVLARLTSLDAPTAALGMVAGGASGIVGISDELGADDRLVAFMQYLRVLLIVAAHARARGARSSPARRRCPTRRASRCSATRARWLLTAATALAGGPASRRLRFPGARPAPADGLARPCWRSACPAAGSRCPPLLRELAFALIGLQVGLRFTLDTIRELGRLLVPVLLGVLGVLVACALLAVVLDVTTSVSLRDAYLATTPGGLYAVSRSRSAPTRTPRSSSPRRGSGCSP